jgi:hypothetical protein
MKYTNDSKHNSKHRFAAVTAGVLCSFLALTTVNAGTFHDYYGNNNMFAFRYDDSTGEIKKSSQTNDYKRDNPPDYSKPAYDVVVPSQIDGTAITSVAYLGFYDEDRIKSIELPSTLKTIGEKGFYGCDRISEFDLTYVNDIGDSAFFSCDALEKVTLGDDITVIKPQVFMNNKNLKDVEFGNGIVKIDSRAFSGCRSLVDLRLPSSLRLIGDSAFQNCSSIKTVVIPYGVTEIEANAFSGCTNLEAVYIPETVSKIGKNAFKDCTSLEQINIPLACRDIDYTILDGCSDVIVGCEVGSRAATLADKYNFRKVEYYYQIDEDGVLIKGTTEATTEEVTDKVEETTEATTEKVTSSAVEETTTSTESTNNQGINLFVNGREVDCSMAAPLIKNNRTLVPMRPLFEALDIQVKWIEATKTVVCQKDNTQIELTIGSKNAVINGEVVTVEVAPEIIKGYTYMPVRFLTENLGFNVNWDEETKSVEVSK